MVELRFRSYLLFLMGYGGPRWFKIIAFIWQTRATLGNFTCKEWIVDELPFVPFFLSQSRAYHGGVVFSRANIFARMSFHTKIVWLLSATPL